MNENKTNEIQFIEGIILSEKEKSKELSEKIVKSSKAIEFCDKLQKYIVNDWYLHAIDLIKDNSSIINEIKLENPNLEFILSEHVQLAKKGSEEDIKKFPLKMEQIFKDTKPSIDMTSKHPKYTFENGFLQLQLNESSKRVKISDYEGKLHDMPADTKAIKEILQFEYKRIFERPFKKSDFLKKIRNNYLAVINKMEKKDGDSIHVRSITQRLGKNEKGFRTDEFVIDLSKLIREGPMEIDNLKLELQQTKDDNQGMLLYQIPGIGYIGQINFKKI